MECARLKNWHAYMNKRKKFLRLDLDGGYTDNIYILYGILSGQLKKRGGDSHIGDTEILPSLIK